MDQALVEKIDAALAEVHPMAEKLFAPAMSIERQLAWCRAFLVERGTIEGRPGPLSMGLIAVREFDMYGDRPELSSLINDIQAAMNAKLDLR